MYLSATEARALLTAAMSPKTAQARLRAGDKVISQLNRIAFDPEVPFNQFRAQYLRDCLEAGVPEKSLVLLEKTGFSANDSRDLLETAVALHLAMGKLKPAIEWISTVSYVFGAKAVSGLASKPEFAQLRKSKAYLKVAGKDAEKNFFLTHLAEVKRMWARGEYDNWKDAVQDAKNLAADAKKFGKSHVATANEHLDAVVRRVHKETAKDPGLRRYLRGLV